MLIITIIGYLCTIYISLILFPWIFVIFWRIPPPPEKLIIESKELKIQDTFLIKLESEGNTNPRISSNLKKKLEVRGISNSGSLSSILAKVKDYDNSIELKNIRKLYGDKFFDEVINLGRKRSRVYPNEPKMHLILIRSYYSLKKYRQCLNECEKLLKLDNNNLNGLRFLARSYNRLQNHESAIELYLKILELIPNDKESLRMLIRIYFQETEYKICIGYCKKLLSVDKSDPDAIKFISRCNYNLGNKKETLQKLLETSEREKNNLTPLIMLINIFYDEKNYQECIKFCKKVLFLDNMNYKARKTISRCYYNIGDWKHAEEFLLSMVNLEPFDIDSFVILIRNYYKLKEFKKCEIMCEKLLKIDENNLIAKDFILRCKEKIGSVEEVAESYLKIASNSLHDIKSRKKLIRFYYNKKLYKDCIEICEQVLDIDSKETSILSYIGRCYYNLGNNEKAKKYLSIFLKINKEDIKILTLMVRINFNLKDYENGIEYCLRVLSINKSDIVVKRLLSRCYYNSGEKEKGEKVLLKLIKKSKRDLESRVTLIRNYYSGEEYEKVHQWCDDILKKKKSNRIALIFHARAYTAQQKFEEAMKAWELVLKKYKNDTEALSGAGRACYNNGEIKLARTFLEKGLEQSPNSSQIMRTLSLVYIRQKEWKKALYLLELECQRSPEKFVNWERKINLLYEMNDNEKALSCLEQILDYIPDKGDAHFMAYAVSKSYFWDKQAAIHLDKALSENGDDVEFYNKFTNHFFDQGILTQVQHFISLGLAKDSLNKNLLFSKNKLDSLLKLLKVSPEYLKSNLDKNIDISISECVIKAIFQRAKNNLNKNWISNKRIAMVSSSLNRGGAERQVISCLEGIKSSSYDVKLFCYGIDNSGGTRDTYQNELEKLKITTVEFGKIKKWTSEINNAEKLLKPWSDLLTHLNARMRREIEPMFLHFLKYKPSIVHTWQDTTNICSGLAAAMAGVPKILMFARSLRPDGKTILHMRNRSYLRESYRLFLESKNFTLCLNSKVGVKSYADWLDVPSSKIKVLYNGTDFSGLEEICKNESIDSDLIKFNILKDQKVIGAVFRFVSEKRPHLWINTAEIIIKKHPNIQFVLIGGGGLFEVIKNEIEIKGLSSRIHLVGQTNLVKLWLDRMDLFLMTSKVEGLPNVLIEAQGFGVPVVSTNAGGAIETFQDGETGFVVNNSEASNIAEKIVNILFRDEWLKQASINAKIEAREKFDKTTMFSNLLKLYSNL